MEEKEEPEDLVVSIVQAMNLDIQKTDISTAYRIPLQKDKPSKTIPRLYVKFIRRKHKRFMYSNRTKQPVSHRQIGFSSSGKVYIHEHLTKSQAELFHHARDKVREASYKYIWTQDQKIFVKYNDTSKRILISNEKDLEHIACSDTNSARTLRSNSRSKP
jgi:hypothetical protein